MRDTALLWLGAFVRVVLTGIWDGVWELIFEGVGYAEEQWEDQSERKKKYVMGLVMDYVDDNKDLGFVRRKAVELFLSRVIDGVIKAIQDELGDNWVEAAKEYQKELAGLLPFIK